MLAHGRSALAIGALALSLGAATAAHAQLGDPGQDTLDTDVTPVAKESERWQWWAGATYKGTPDPSDVPAESVTPFELDFFDVAFTAAENGLAGGAVCREPVPEGTGPEEALTHTEGCERVPALYRHFVDEIEGPTWERVDLGESASSRGYIGAIAWIDSDTALAVGGEGCYPRREEPCPDGLTPTGEDPAGMARAWLYDQGSVTELNGLPAEMRGLTALGVSPRKDDCGEGTQWGCAAAGALRQLWHFRDGAFVSSWSSDGSAGEPVGRSDLFSYRVRDLAFGPSFAVAVTSGCCSPDPLRNGASLLVFDGEGWQVSSADTFYGDPSLRPVERVWDNSVEKPRNDTEEDYDFNRDTFLEDQHRNEDGSCSDLSSRDGNNLVACIWNDGDERAGVPIAPLEPTFGPWPFTGPLDPPDNLPVINERPPGEEVVDPVVDSVYGPIVSGVEEETRGARNKTVEATPYADSFYGLYGVGKPQFSGVGLLSSPGGPAPGSEERLTEPPSQVARGSFAMPPADSGSPSAQAFVPSIGSSLVSVTAAPPESARATTPTNTARLHSIDWTPMQGPGEPRLTGTISNRRFEALGVLRSTGQGLAWGPYEEEQARGNPNALHGCGEDIAKSDLSTCDPDAERFLAQYEGQGMFLLPSYALNGVDVADDVTGEGWAVGDHGAILGLAGQSKSQAQGLEPDPPSLGARRPGPLPDTSAYDPYRKPLSSEPGTVPSLGGGEIEHFGEQRFVAASVSPGFSGSMQSIVMSRDGSEGWAFATDAIFHYDGVSWRPCREGTSAPDPHCPDLGPLAVRGAEVLVPARIQLEYDSDPSNDEEFEVFALGKSCSESTCTRRVLLYRDGSWRFEDGALAEGIDAIPPGSAKVIPTASAFGAPDDGWIVTDDGDGPSVSGDPAIFHFNGREWIDCLPQFAASPPDCDDPDGRLPRTIETTPGIGGSGATDRGALSLTSAGGRVYLSATRRVATTNSTRDASHPLYPMIIYHDLGETWRGSADGSDGGLDPGWYVSAKQTVGEYPLQPIHPAVDDRARDQWETPKTAVNGLVDTQGVAQGRVYSVAVTQTDAGEFEGWAVGEFGGKGSDAKAVMLRLEDGRWTPWERADASAEYLRASHPNKGIAPKAAIAFAGGDATHDAIILGGGSPPLGFNQGAQRWGALDAPFTPRSEHPVLAAWLGTANALAPDGRGGAWLPVAQRCDCGNAVTFYNYTESAPRPIFEPAPDPVAPGQAITSTAAGADGSLWIATDANVLYRRDRIAGWNSVSIPGWDPGRVAANPSEVSEVAIGPAGEGVAVGPGGRIAELTPQTARLDAAAGRVCDFASPVAPCGTGRDLTQAAVAPDGSAILAGKGLTALVWRPAGGEFRTIDPPPRLPRTSVFTEVSMPAPDRAWLVTGHNALVTADGGERLYRGELTDTGWRWELELEAPVRQLHVDASGHGYAIVGDQLWERAPGSAELWHPLETGYERRFDVFAVPPNGAPGLIAGGEHGAIFTLPGGRLELARPADAFAPAQGSEVGLGPTTVGLALIPGSAPGEIEAFAVVQDRPRPGGPWDRNPAAHELLRYTSDPASASALPDIPAPGPAALAFAAFGKQDCQGPADCWETGGNRTHAVVSRRVVAELRARAGEPGGPAFSLFSGDQSSSPKGRRTSHPFLSAETPLNADLKQPRWVELTADPLTAAGVPVVAALGGQDLSAGAEACSGGFGCYGTAGVPFVRAPSTGIGLNASWRASMARMPAPWLREDAMEAGPLHFEPVGDPLSQSTPRASVAGPDDEAAAEVRVPTPLLLATSSFDGYPSATAEVSGGAPTHYAFDVADESQDGSPIARIVVVDTSMGSLAASDPQQEPIVPGGQLAWLERMLCVDGSAQDTDDDVQDCTREPGQSAIVLSNRPTYAYAQIDPSKLQQDAATLESTLLRYDVSALVTGHVGWNGLYYTCAPGLHYPAPGQGYPTREPKGVEDCVAATGSEDAPDVASEAASALAGTPTGALPVVVASGAGGELAQPNGEASDGFWHGYSIVHLDTETGDVTVEQRPVFEWVAISSSERALEPGQAIRLRGYGREVFGQDTPVRHLDIDSAALTHRYDLLLADPEDPRVPCAASNETCVTLAERLAGSRSLGSAGTSGTDSARDDMSGASASASAGGRENLCDPYICLPERVASVDKVTGAVRAGNGKYPDTFAIGMLSVGDHVATYPLVFKRSPSFIVNPAVGFPAIPNVPTDTASPGAPPPPPPPPTPNVPQVNTPAPPLPPPVAPLQAAQPPEPQPPAPPAPPPPTEQPSPLSLTLAPPSIAIATPTAVIQPPTPPVNPAPPGGARREARQRQAAAQKSGADNEEGGSEGVSDAVDTAGGRREAEGAQMTRRDTRVDRHSFTALAHTEQPSAWAQGALYTGGITLVAFALAAGWSRGRPTPRRRSPEVPAPAHARIRGR